jgi:dTDP-4-dehydrorhamnose reductase
MDQLLITGGSGLLGSTVARQAADEYNVLATYLSRKIEFDGVDCHRIDLTEEAAYKTLRDFDPDGIIHCAALADVDACERKPTVAHECNVNVAESVAHLANELNARLIHISTDAVFDGNGRFYEESDEPSPINTYGETKLEAERRISNIHNDAAIVRTSIYGWNATSGQSLAEWMLSKLESGEKLPGFNDVYFTPIFTGSLSDCLLELVTKDYRGVIHVTGQERCSKLQFAHLIADVFDFDDSRVRPISVAEAELDAPRGKDLSLSIEKAHQLLDCQLPTVREGLERMKQTRR